MDRALPASAYVLIDDELHPRARAALPVSDRGFLFGDAVYETLRAYGGCPFLLEEHLQRLRRSATALYLDLPWTDAELAARLRRLLAANRIGEGRIRITVTRGSGDVRARPDQLGPPRLVMSAEPLAAEDEVIQEGVKVEISRRVRNLPDALDPAIKSGNLLNNLLARFEMKDPDSFEVLLPNQQGELTEGSLSNLFIVDETGRLRTPALASGLLPGITRALVLELAALEGLATAEVAIMPAELLAAREAFLTASTIEILPVAQVEERMFPAPLPGPRTLLLRERYRARVRDYCRRQSSGA